MEVAGTKVDWLVQRVVESASDVVKKAALRLHETERLRQTACVLIVDGSDTIAREYYDHCLQAGMSGPPKLKPYVVTTFTQPYAPLVDIAVAHYEAMEHVEPPLGPGEVRAVVLTLGTLTVVRLDERSNPQFASPSYRPLRPDVLVGSVCCWRNDRPEGFLVHAVFATRKQGTRFWRASRSNGTSSRAPTSGAIEEELLRFKPTYGKRDVQPDVEAKVYAQVAWLEDGGHLPDDNFNGVVLTFGCEMELRNAGELARELGGPADDLN